MAKLRRRSHLPLSYFLIPLFLLIVVLGYGYYRSLVQPSNIFVIEETAIQYGDTTVNGILRKDTVIGESGTYILVLPDGRPILLDVQGLDNLVGSSVIVTGNLSPAIDTLSPMTMIVNTITTSDSL
ncbi:MAG: hypothetical protein UX63_C0032G0004 [Microgenomates group bacterium GW2011_GWB1_46_7]|nr:MAG: hypothetical protein UX63_C0032G0004 [Microgenomates group bacterium GW2011_GWB1_46_7]HBD02083.1 hypothetical protein [Candidatus Collierbacteria bacterium]